MAGMRSYDDGCGTAHALDLVGERWALLVVRELLLGSKRFTDLREGLPGASPNVLSQRLRELERDGLVRRHKLPPPASSRVYELTDWGHELEPVIIQLGCWGRRSPAMPLDARISVDALVLSLRARFDAREAADLSASYELRLGEHRFRAVVAGGRINLARGTAERPDAIIDTSLEALRALVSGRTRLTDEQRTGALTIVGDQQAAERFVALFSGP